jgi:hypothetical protein
LYVPDEAIVKGFDMLHLLTAEIEAEPGHPRSGRYRTCAGGLDPVEIDSERTNSRISDNASLARKPSS